MTNQGADSKEDSPYEQHYGIFIYFFDELKGHIPLYSYPIDLMQNEAEKRILSVHSIWWHQDQFLESEKHTHIDLEIQNTVYSATLFFCKSKRKKRRLGMDSKKWQYERFVLIIKAPASVSFIAHEILQKLKSHLEINMESKMCAFVERKMELSITSEENELLEVNFTKTIHELNDICLSLIPRVPLSKLQTVVSDIKTPIPQLLEKRTSRPNKLRFSIPAQRNDEKKGKIEKKSLENKNIRIIGMKIDETIKLELLNAGNIELVNITLKVFQSEGFFGKDIYKAQISSWKPKEKKEIIVKADLKEGYIYFLKIDDEEETIKLKRILG